MGRLRTSLDLRRRRLEAPVPQVVAGSAGVTKAASCKIAVKTVLLKGIAGTSKVTVGVTRVEVASSARGLSSPLTLDIKR